jgi:hypothetical protein
MGAKIVILTYYYQVVKVGEGWVEHEFVPLTWGCQMSKYSTGYLIGRARCQVKILFKTRALSFNC